MVDDAVDQRQVVRRRTDGANEEMPVATASLKKVHVLVVHLGAGCILDLGPEMVGDVVGEGFGGNGASRGHGGPGEQGRKGSSVHHVGLLRGLQNREGGQLELMAEDARLLCCRPWALAPEEFPRAAKPSDAAINILLQCTLH